MLQLIAPVLLVVALACALRIVEAAATRRSAIVATIAGPNKLSKYFEWTCRSILYSRDSFDLLIFHESNEVILNKINCADNVKFIDLGPNGLSKLIVEKTIGDKIKSEKTINDLKDILANIMLHMPRYLIEVKPMTGTLFEGWLTEYSHWSYTDLDIIWGNLTNWLNDEDYDFDILTVSKIYDASRLFLRGQFTLHKNTEVVNNLWRKLTFFDPNDFASRLSGANKMIQDRKDTNQIMDRYFHSAEGWYSKVVLHDDRLRVKVLGRGFDDFSSEPIILHRGYLIRCSNTKNPNSIKNCISNEMKSPQFASVHDLPPLQLKEAKTFSGENACRMFWLPITVRYCIAVDSKESGNGNKIQDSLRMEKLGETFMENGKWKSNDEKLASRQFSKSGAFFHFRHWDDFLATSIETTWSSNNMLTSDFIDQSGFALVNNSLSVNDEMALHCMILHIKEDKKMVFEPCINAYNSVTQHKSSSGKSNLRKGKDTKDRDNRDNRERREHHSSNKAHKTESMRNKEGTEDLDSLLKSKRHGMERGH